MMRIKRVGITSNCCTRLYDFVCIFECCLPAVIIACGPVTDTTKSALDGPVAIAPCAGGGGGGVILGSATARKQTLVNES